MEVSNCSNMEAIVGEGNQDEMMEFAQLTSLKLSYLPDLRGICRKGGTVSFPNLTSLMIWECKSLKYVFTTSMVKSLKQLKKLEISECVSMEEIILGSNFEEIQEAGSINTIVFPELDFIELDELPNLKRFGSGYRFVFPKLRELVIDSCSEMKNFVSKDSDIDEYLFNELVTFPNLEIIYFDSMSNLRYIWHQQFADNDSFSKLKSLRIEECPMLLAVFPSNAYGRFWRLESLHVYDCPDLKQGLLQLQELEVQSCGAEMIIAEIKTERSRGATKTFRWPKLKSLIIKDCDKLINLRSQISKAKNNIPTLESLYFIEKITPDVKFFELDHHSLKAIQSVDHPFPHELLWKLTRFNLIELKEE